ncbi:hypothetical protein SB763_34395, partial [Burkholderia sp. SIMBA_042]
GTKDQKDALESYKKAIAEIDQKLLTMNPLYRAPLEMLKKQYQQSLAKLNAEIAAGAMSGSFDGLSQEEIDLLKNDYKNDPRIQG